MERAQAIIVKSKKRNTSFELLRIIIMLMIVFLHFLQHTDFFVNYCEKFGVNYYIFRTIQIMCLIAVNCFILISGYFLVHSKFKLQRILEIWGLAIFYSIGIYWIDSYTGQTTLKLDDQLHIFAPILNNHYWFVVAYIALYTIFPFLNRFIKSLSKKQYSVLLIVLFFVLSLFDTASFANEAIDAAEGHSLIWFMYLYMVGAYIRLHFSRATRRRKYFLVYAIMVIISILVNTVFEKLKATDESFALYAKQLLSFNSAFIFIESVMFFLIFKNIKIKKELINKTILLVSPTVFGVYLIHEHIIMRKYFWTDWFNPYEYIEKPSMLLFAIGAVIAVFLICCTIELIRKGILKIIFKIPIVNTIREKFNTRCDKINQAYQRLIQGESENE